MTTRRCIYCLEEKPDTAFNREHVIPRALGTFDQDNLVLDCVCKDCNDFFGRELDRKLGRDTAAGFLRFHLGLVQPGDFKPYGRGSTSYAEITNGPLKGVICARVVSEAGREAEAVVQPQIGLPLCEDGSYSYTLIQELPPASEFMAGKPPERLRPVRVFWTTDHSIEDIQKLLREKGYTPDAGQPIEVSPGLAEYAHVFAPSSMEFRAAAKLAMNYVAAVLGPREALSSHFDEVRSYVRRGNDPGWRVTEAKPINPADLDPSLAQPLYHLLAISRAGPSILALVSIHCAAKYVVRLTGSPLPPGFKPAFTHLFNVRTRRVTATSPIDLFA